MKIKIFGERNTGTNAIERILEQNSKSYIFPGDEPQINPFLWKCILHSKKMGLSKKYRSLIRDSVFYKQPITKQWKHCATNFNNLDELDDVHFIFMVRDPLSWLLSLYKNPYESLVRVPSTFGEFMHCEWPTLGRDRLNRRTISPMQLYKEKIASYKLFIQRLCDLEINYTVIKFESLIQNQEREFQRVSEYLDAPQKAFQELIISTKSEYKNLQYYQEYYGQGLWRSEILFSIRRDFDFDSDLMKWLGYDKAYYTEEIHL